MERRVKEASALRIFFHDQLQHLTALFGKEVCTDQLDQANSLPLEEAIDEMVRGTDARMRAVSDYKKRLRNGISDLLKHIDGIVEQLPASIELSRHNFVYHPQINTYFSSLDEIRILCHKNKEVSEYFQSQNAAGLESFFALLFMRCREKDIFGSEFVGDVLHRDVKQTSVFFTDHRLLAPAKSENGVRKALKHILFENVVGYLKGQLNRQRYSDAVIDKKSSVTYSKLQNLNNPSIYLSTLTDLLNRPISLVRMHENTLKINSMGIKIPDSESTNDEGIQVHHLEVGDSYNCMMLLVEISLKEL